MKGFSGIKDVDLKILSELDDESLFRTCSLNKELLRICNTSPMFWRDRFLKNFGKFPLKYKPKERSWKDHYIQTFINLQMFKENPTKFLDYILWDSSIKDSYFIQDRKHERLENAPEWVMANLWLLDLGTMKVHFHNGSKGREVFNHITPYQLYQKLKYHGASKLKFRDGIWYADTNYH